MEDESFQIKLYLPVLFSCVVSLKTNSVAASTFSYWVDLILKFHHEQQNLGRVHESLQGVVGF